MRMKLCAALVGGIVVSGMAQAAKPPAKPQLVRFDFSATVQADGTSSPGYNDSLSDSSVTTTLNIGARNNGASLAMDGELHELIIFNEPLSQANREKVEGYLAHKWGLTNNLPSDHPYKYEPPYKVEP